MKKVLLKYYCQRNFGDDLFVKIFAEQLSDSKIYIFGNPKYLPKGLGRNVRISPWSWLRTLAAKAQASGNNRMISTFLSGVYNFTARSAGVWSDAIVEIGGSIFMEKPTTEGHREIDFSVSKEIPRVFSHYTDSRSDSKKFIIGANLGPVYSEDYFDRMEHVFAEYAHVCLRDYASKKQYQFDRYVGYAPDVGFLY